MNDSIHTLEQDADSKTLTFIKTPLAGTTNSNRNFRNTISALIRMKLQRNGSETYDSRLQMRSKTPSKMPSELWAGESPKGHGLWRQFLGARSKTLGVLLLGRQEELQDGQSVPQRTQCQKWLQKSREWLRK